MEESKEKKLVHAVESDTLQHSKISKLSPCRELTYFTRRAGIIRLACLAIGSVAVGLLWWGFFPEDIAKGTRFNDKIRQMRNSQFTGYKVSYFTHASMVLGSLAVLISFLFIFLLCCFLEVRNDLLWERINQRAHVLACVLSIAAAFTGVMSIQTVLEENCGTTRCREEVHRTKNLKYEEPFYPPYYTEHYAAFVLFLGNSILYSIASRIWLKNED